MEYEWAKHVVPGILKNTTQGRKSQHTHLKSESLVKNSHTKSFHSNVLFPQNYLPC